MTIPYIGVGNDELGDRVSIGDTVTCPNHPDGHVLKGDDNGGDFLMFYRCGSLTMLAAIKGKLMPGVRLKWKA